MANFKDFLSSASLKREKAAASEKGLVRTEGACREEEEEVSGDEDERGRMSFN